MRIGSNAHRTTHLRIASAFAAGAIFISLAGCSAGTPTPEETGGTATEAIDGFNAMTGTARHDALVAAAQEEGVVVFYSTAPGWQPVLDAFSDTYDVDVEVFNGRSDTILQRVVQEYQAGLNSVDVFEDENAALLEETPGITANYVNDELTSQIPGYDGAAMVPFRLSVPAVTWNTDLVSDDEVPLTIEDLADPKWDGKLTLDSGAWEWYAGVYGYLSDKGWDDAKIEDFFTTIISYSNPQATSIAETALLSAGEYSMATGILTQVASRTAAKGSPIAWQTAEGRYVTPLIIAPEGGVLMANSPHPAAAMLLMDFILTEGAQLLLDNGTFINSAVPLEGGPMSNVKSEDTIVLDTNALMLERDKWSQAWDALVRKQ